MKNEFDKRFWIVLFPSWILSAFFFLVFLKNSGWLPSTPSAINEIVYLLVSLVFFVLPFVSRMKLGQLLEFERKLNETKEDVSHFKNETRQMFSVLSAASATANVHIHGHDEGAIRMEAGKFGPLRIEEGAKEPEPKKGTRTAMEYKILNTLWNKQVGKFPDLAMSFTFRLNAPAPEFFAFREAGNSLLIEGLIGETDIGQFYLTQPGLRYCAKNYKEFPPAMWGEPESLYKDNLSHVLRMLEG